MTAPTPPSEQKTTLTYPAEFSNGNSGTAATINWNAGQKQAITLTGNATFTFTAPNGVGNFIIRLVQDATGSRTVTWPTGTNGVKWVGSAAPTLTTAANAIDIVTFYWNGTNYYGSYGLNFG
jgi:hypothetical protein